MSPTRRRRVMTTRSRLTVGTAVLAVLAGGGLLTRTAASAAPAPAPRAVACVPPRDADGGQAGHDHQASGSTRQPSQQLSGEASWARGCRPLPAPSASPEASPAASAGASPEASPAASPAPSPAGPTPPLDILGNSCKESGLDPHTGFQDGNRCVSTEFGEVGTADKNPSLLITSAPQRVRVDEFFDLKVSTRNLVRDRFLKAAQGGYYKESSFLTADGLVRGHFHTACRMLATTTAAPDPEPAPAFFVATEDGKGGAEPDTVTIRVLGMPQRGLAQCAVWAGDGSHRIPMMQRANQVPAFDAVRIRVR